MDRRTAIESLSPVHAHALGLLDDGLDRSVVAARLDLDVVELEALVQVAEAKVDRLLREPAAPQADGDASPSASPDAGE